MKKFELVATELCVFLSQFFVFFIVTFFISNMLNDEDKLTDFVSGKLNGSTSLEIFLTLFAITSVIGLLFFIREMTISGFAEKVAREVIRELPRTIYLFGSSISAVTIAAALFLLMNPESMEEVEEGSDLGVGGIVAMSLFIGGSFFAYGLAIKCGLNRKAEHIKKLDQAQEGKSESPITPTESQV